MKTPIIATAALILGFGINASAQATTKAPVNQRQQNQKARIKQGEASGELTHKEANKLKTEHKAIHQEVKAERTVNGGKLTPAERQQVKQQQNQASKDIYKQKHDAQVKP